MAQGIMTLHYPNGTTTQLSFDREAINRLVEELRRASSAQKPDAPHSDRNTQERKE